MPDRRLNEEEMEKFLEEKKTRKLRIALDALLEESTEPSLHDLCLLELDAIAQVHRELIIQQERDINELKEKIKALEGRIAMSKLKGRGNSRLLRWKNYVWDKRRERKSC